MFQFYYNVYNNELFKKEQEENQIQTNKRETSNQMCVTLQCLYNLLYIQAFYNEVIFMINAVWLHYC